MDFRQRIIDELKLTSLQADTMLKDYIEVCEKLAKEYHALQLQQTGVSGSTSINLQIMYGELMQELTTERDYFNKQRIQKKMKAIEVLLEIDFVS